MSAEQPETGPGKDDAPARAAKGGDVMSSLPRTRPQRPSRRRASASGKGRAAPERAARTAAKSGTRGTPAAKRASAATGRPKPAGVRPSAATEAASKPPPPKRPPSPPTGTHLVGTAVQAAGELAQLGLTLGTRALRGAVKRVPRP